MNWNFPEIKNARLTKSNLLNLSRESKIHYFLWISHGNNVSGNNNFYPIKTDFISISLYSAPFSIITNTILEEISNKGAVFSENICNLVYGHCPKIPIENNNDPNFPTKYVHLPPLIFSGDDPVSGLVSKYVGLYHLEIMRDPNESKNISPKKTCGIWNSKKILNNNDIYGNIYTYSRIFSEVKKYCFSKNIDYTNVLLGIYSCQLYINYENLNNYSEIEALVPKLKNVKSLLKATIINSEKEYNSLKRKNKVGILCKLPLLIDPKSRWNSFRKQYDIKYQGCGIQILEFFGIIEEGNEKIMCLGSRGTGIFDIIDYISAYLNKINITNEFMAIRVNIDEGLAILERYFVEVMKESSNKMSISNDVEWLSNPDNRFYIIIKLNNNSDKGHTISLILTEKGIELLDVQMGISKELLGMLELKNMYSGYSRMDIIMRIVDESEKSNVELRKEDMNNTIISRNVMNGVIKGGMIKDEFVEIMKKLDKENNIESALIVENVEIKSSKTSKKSSKTSKKSSKTSKKSSKTSSKKSSKSSSKK
jgi:hypothetical protein